jgi:hypothetical protein
MNVRNCIMGLMAGALFSSCAIWVNSADNPNAYPDTTQTTHNNNNNTNNNAGKILFKTASLFPFEDNANWWHYTEASGNTVFIEVTDTISDNKILYFKVSFKENRVDTTDDWFKRGVTGIMFGPSLVGSYDMFLPVQIDSVKGSFYSGSCHADFEFHDTLTLGLTKFRRVLVLNYDNPILHGFTTIAFADSVGIVELKDSHERWPIDYELDSCNVSGNVRHF